MSELPLTALRSRPLNGVVDLSDCTTVRSHPSPHLSPRTLTSTLPSDGWNGGAIPAAIVCYACNNIQSNWAWRIPMIGQGSYSIAVMCLVWFLPEVGNEPSCSSGPSTDKTNQSVVASMVACQRSTRGGARFPRQIPRKRKPQFCPGQARNARNGRGACGKYRQ